MAKTRELYLDLLKHQRQWIAEHGGDLAGYIARYGDSPVPNANGGTPGPGDGTAIYNADMAELHRIEERAGIPSVAIGKPRELKVPITFTCIAPTTVAMLTFGGKQTWEMKVGENLLFDYIYLEQDSHIIAYAGMDAYVFQPQCFIKRD